VLIVDDDASIAKALVELCKRLQVESLACSRPQEALEQVRSFKPQLIFVDCLLPQMAGDELIMKIRETPGFTETPMILMSGIFTDKKYIKEKTAQTKASRFLVKPFDLQEISELIKSFHPGSKIEISPRKLLYQ